MFSNEISTLKMLSLCNLLKMILVVVLTIVLMSRYIDCCSNLCRCSTVKARNPEKLEIGQRVVCFSVNKFLSLKDVNLEALPNDTIYLILRENSLASLQPFSFVEVPGLLKLDLSKNLISEIQDGAFANLSLLEKLDLSQNRLASLHLNSFSPLTSLQRLLLEGNLLNRLPERLFEHQSVLRMLDLASNPLICDCELKWLIEWTRNNGVRIPAVSSCQFPMKLRGTSLFRLTKKNLHCKWPVQLPLFELIPQVSQLVFEGDALSFCCRVSNIEHDTQVIWMLNGEMLEANHKNNLTTETHPSSDGSILISSLFIEHLQSYHSGFWMCHINTSRGAESRTVHIVVVADNSEICPRTITSDNKGQYMWPETLVGITVERDCIGTPASSLGYETAHAYYTCSTNGIWENLNTSFCPYVSEVTKVLEQFSKTNFTLSKTNVLDSARGLRNYTSDNSLLRDKMDIVFISQTLENYVPFVSRHREMAEIIVDIVNTVMSVDRKFLNDAEVKSRACSRLVKILEHLPDLLIDATLNRFRDNIAVEEFFVKSESFPGMTCISYVRDNTKPKLDQGWRIGNGFHGDKVLHCNMANSSIVAHDIANRVEASLKLPASIFQHAEIDLLSRLQSHKLQFIIYRNGILFPNSMQQGHHIRDITSCVISSKIAHATIHNLSDPVIVTLRTPAYTSDATPVWWDSQAAEGKGDWSADGCRILAVYKNLVTFSCNHLASFGLLQDVEALILQYSFQMAQFRPCHPAVYIGSLLCVIPLIFSIAIYCCGFRKMQMPKKTKHSLINTWLSLTLLCLIFSLGVHQTDVAVVCQGVGLTLHYLTLCCLLWMLITASNLYKKLTKPQVEELPTDEPLPENKLPPKPMLRFYLVGWGISLIVCGISAAVNLENYGGTNYCFLSLNPSLGALYGPAAVLLIILSILYLLLQCFLHGGESSRYPKVTEDNVVMELIQSSVSAPKDTRSEAASSESQEDIEFSFQSQLRAHAMLLLLFILAWGSAAASVGRLFSNYLMKDELIFSLLFCLFSASAGIFVFSFFCYYRHDTRHFLATWFEKKKTIVETEMVESEPLATDPNMIVNSVNGQDTHSLVSKAGTSVTIGLSNSKVFDPNLLHSYSNDYIGTGAEIFYDPRQSVVARRFFEKNRRQQQLQQLHKNNLEKAANQNKTKVTTVMSNDTVLESSHELSDCQNIIADHESRTKNAETKNQTVAKTIMLSLLPINSEIHEKHLGENASYHGHLISSEKGFFVDLSDSNSKPPSSAISKSCSSHLNEDGSNRFRKSRNQWKRRQHSWDSRNRISNRKRNCAHNDKMTAPANFREKRCICHLKRSSTYEHLGKGVLEDLAISSPSEQSAASSNSQQRDVY